MKMHYKIVLDNGKPYEKTAETEEELKSILEEFYLENINDRENYFPFNAIIFNENGEDISESQFIAEIIADILINSDW